MVTMSSACQTIEWREDEKRVLFILDKALINFRVAGKSNVSGRFGNLLSKEAFPANCEIHFSPVASVIDIGIQTGQSFITTAMINYRTGKFEFSFTVDNLMEEDSQPPSFEILQNPGFLKMQQLDFKPGSPKFLQLSTTINF